MPVKSYKVFKSRSKRRRKGTKPNRVYRMVKNAFLNLVESKYHDVVVENTTMNQSGGYSNLTSLVQGNSDITRNGDKIKAVSLQLRLYVTANLNSTQPVEGRIILWQYRDSNTTAPNAFLPLERSTTVGQKLVSPYYHDRGSEFVVLRDYKYSLPAQYTGTVQLAATGRARFFTTTVRFTPKQSNLSYIASTSDGHNQIYLTYFSTLNTNPPELTIYSRLVYKDA